MENNGLQINQIVKGVNAGTFIILGFKTIANSNYAQLKAVNPDNFTETAQGEIALPLANIKPINEIQGHKAFVDYVLGFYGPSGLYSFDASAEEIKDALLVRLERWPNIVFCGDTTDRELVRDIMLEKRQKAIAHHLAKFKHDDNWLIGKFGF